MCEAKPDSKIVRTPNRRAKLWELPTGFQCSVVGACLSFSELKKLNRKLTARCSDFQTSFKLHTYFASLSSAKSSDAAVVHKALDTKYRKTIQRFRKAKNDDDLNELWQEAIKKGTVSGAYWALMTHPRVSDNLRSSTYGTLHMMSHEYVNKYFRAVDKNRQLNTRLACLDEVLTNERMESRRREEQLEQETAAIRVQLEGVEAIQHKSNYAESSSASYEDRVEQLLLKQAEDDREIKRLKKQLSSMQSHVDYLEEAAARADKQHDSLEREKQRMAADLAERDRELVLFENTILQRMEDSCDGCDAAGSAECPGKNLCGKTILYVGGMHKMVPHYRKLVEHSGGAFMHHDGGRETSCTRLPGMLCQADVVMCPVDCVSHDACLSVKKLCKQYQKQYVMMRSSGLSSLARGLDKFVQ